MVIGNWVFGHFVIVLPRRNRLTLKKDFDRAARTRPFHAPHCTLRAISNGLTATRVGIVAGLKVSKRSTERNRVKRIIREVFQRHFPSIHTGADIVVHAKPSAVGVSYQEFASEIGFALNRAKALQCPWVDTLAERQKSQKAPGRAKKS